MLKSIVADIESVDENLRALYIETEGRYILGVEPVEGFALEDVTGLKAALAGERKRTRDAVDRNKEFEAELSSINGRLSAFGDLDPIEARRAVARVALGPDADLEARVEGMRSAIAAAAGAEATTLRGEIEKVRDTLKTREAQLQRLTKDNIIAAELKRTKPLSDAEDALALIAAQQVTLAEEGGELVARVIDRHGEPRLDDTGRPMSVRALMLELQQARPSLYEPDRPPVQGLGTGGSVFGTSRALGSPGEANPWSASSWNVTQQVLMTTRNPALAARLRTEAGR